MGNETSREQKREDEKMFERFKEGPDLRVNKSIEMFTSLASSDNLRQHYNMWKRKEVNCTAGWIKNLVEKLANLTPSPELAGLGALAIALLIDSAYSNQPEETTKEALRCVFAEEKASEVWDQIDECLKRCMMLLENKDKLRSDIERIECKLSAALTKLKNSMVRDGHVTSEALKAWVNGAAFHVQILIHLVRLGGIQTCDPVERLLTAYLSDLDPLFKKHKEMIAGKCKFRMWPIERGPFIRWMVDEDSERHDMNIYSTFHTFFEDYYKHRYDRQKTDILEYFSNIKQNLQELVLQRGSLKSTEEEADQSEEEATRTVV